MKLSDRTYDILKAIYEILVLLAAFYVKFAETWNLPYGVQIQQTFLDVAAILFGLLKISTIRYHKELNIMKEVADDLEGADEDEVSVG